MFGDQHGEKDVTGTGGGGIWCGESSSPFLLSKMSAPHVCLGADGSLCEPLAMPALPCLAPGLEFWGVRCRAISRGAVQEQRGPYFWKSQVWEEC